MIRIMFLRFILVVVLRNDCGSKNRGRGVS